MKKIAPGHLFGFTDNYKYNWSAVGVVLELNDGLKISFNVDNSPYDVLGKQLKPSYYVGKLIYRKKDEVGNVYFWVYENKYGIVINGQWEEDHITYELFGKFSWAK
jgi:hypothetical protein